jgi:nucleotide-binding universal stress UspA family protein
MICILSQIKGKFSKILIPVDGSEESMNAADYAIAMAKKADNDSHMFYSRKQAMHILQTCLA